MTKLCQLKVERNGKLIKCAEHRYYWEKRITRSHYEGKGKEGKGGGGSRLGEGRRQNMIDGLVDGLLRPEKDSSLDK